jgi:hypothetical protein
MFRFVMGWAKAANLGRSTQRVRATPHWGTEANPSASFGFELMLKCRNRSLDFQLGF